ncbi:MULTISPECIES: serine hydrolase domain-containing protein [unclassified Pseudoalteromonas]|uniref:serine hydrolase domain-containing protein n=1 Tax=unclassified Pseudoalteromonas TaxID=194690 RepID=UPI0030151ADB
MKKSSSAVLMCTALLTVSYFSHSQTIHSDTTLNQASTKLLPRVRVAGKAYSSASIVERMQDTHLPGLSVAVLKDGQLKWAQGFGIANKEHNTQVTTQTLFQAGSISKPMAALAALKLVAEGKLALDTNINQYLTSWQIPKNAFTQQQPVTLRQLLTHTSGLSQHGFPGYERSASIPGDVAVLNGGGNTDKVVVNSLPGQSWRYSGGGYTVMELLVQDVSKMPFSQYMQQHILLPLGMTNSTYAQPLPKSHWSQASAAFDGNGEQIKGDWHVYPEQAAAGLWTTPSDLTKYITAVQRARAGTSTGPITPELVNQMLEIHHDTWGLGPELKQHKQGLVFFHGGKNKGFTNYLEAYADKGDGIVIMANGDAAGPVIGELRIALSELYDWDFKAAKEVKPVALTKALRSGLPGVYKYEQDDNFKMKVSVADEQIRILDMWRNNDMEFVASDEKTLVWLESGTEVDIEHDSHGDVAAIVWAGEYRFVKAANE